MAERISYATNLGLRVPAIVYSPQAESGRRPALIIVNGHGGDKYAWYAFYSGILYARAGAVVLTYDPIGEGERNVHRESGTRAHDTLQEPREMGRRMGGQMVTDLMQAVSYLSQRPDVDPDRIAACGYSMRIFHPRSDRCYRASPARLRPGGGRQSRRSGRQLGPLQTHVSVHPLQVTYVST